MASGMDMLINAVLKASGLSMDQLKGMASDGITRLDAFSSAQLNATASLARVEATLMRIENRLNGSPSLPDESLYPPEAYADTPVVELTFQSSGYTRGIGD